MTEIEKLLDENNNENIVLYDENNNETVFEQAAIIPLNDKIYAILAPVTPIPGVNEGEGLVFVIEEIDDEDCLVIVDDEDIISAVFEKYYELLDEAD